MKVLSLLIFMLFTAFFLCLYACAQGNHEGKALYKTHCANCHGDMGEGLEDLNPPLAASDVLQAAGAGAACWIRKGLQGKIMVNGREFEHVMPAMPQLSAIEITNILNFVNNSWGNKRNFITLEEVNKVLEGCK